MILHKQSGIKNLFGLYVIQKKHFMEIRGRTDYDKTKMIFQFHEFSEDTNCLSANSKLISKLQIYSLIYKYNFVYIKLN